MCNWKWGTFGLDFYWKKKTNCRCFFSYLVQFYIEIILKKLKLFMWCWYIYKYWITSIFWSAFVKLIFGQHFSINKNTNNYLLWKTYIFNVPRALCIIDAHERIQGSDVRLYIVQFDCLKMVIIFWICNYIHIYLMF